MAQVEDARIVLLSREVGSSDWRDPVAPDQSSDIDLVARLLDAGGRADRIQRAFNLLDQVGGLPGLYRADRVARLTCSPSERARLRAALELGRRALDRRHPGDRLLTAEAVVGRFRSLALAEVEVLVAVGLDPGGRVLVEHRMVGTVDGVAARPRDLLRPVLAAGAVSLIAVHNHPSGASAPSETDIAFTSRLGDACRVCGVQFLDHLVVASGGWSSLRGLGLIAVAEPT